MSYGHLSGLAAPWEPPSRDHASPSDNIEQMDLDQHSLPDFQAHFDQLTIVLESMDDAIVLLDCKRQVVFVNSAAKTTLEREVYRFTNPLWREAIPVASEQMASETFLYANAGSSSAPLTGGSQRGAESAKLLWIRKTAQHGIWVTAVERLLRDKQGHRQGSMIVCRDISDHKRAEEKLLHDAFHDQLTGLPNRTLLLRQLDQSIARSRQFPGYQFAVIFLDLDRFKLINDSLGPTVGDQLLIAVSERLQACIDGNDTLVRLGGDEFAILLTDTGGMGRAHQMAERIEQELVLPFNLNGHEVFADVSMGIAGDRRDYERPEEVLRDADIAMHHAKGQGKSCYQMFDKAMHVDAVKLLQLETDMRRAVDRKEFQVYYQPIMSLQGGEIAGFEALARWQHPQRGLIAPSEFIPIAEETGLIIPLGLWVLRESCWQMKQWQLQFPQAKDWTVSVNISGRQLVKPHFIAQIQHVLSETQLSPRNLKLEITESVLLDNSDGIIRVLKQLQALGLQLAMDDFGTGYSSMSYLLNFPFNTLKIDRSFINSMELSSKKLGIVRSIINMSSNLEMNVIAEGIETNDHLAQLKVLRCGYGQGHLFAHALDPQSAEGFILSELSHGSVTTIDENQILLDEQRSQERLLIQIETLQQELDEIKQEKSDLEILLDTATEHASLVESELEEEISTYQKHEAELQKVNQELENLSTIDSLTQLANRRRLDEYLQAQWETLGKEQEPLSLIFIDVDYFKNYNDHYGHQAGDDCLMQVAQVMRSIVQRHGDLAARYGGEEFAVILPRTSANVATQIADSIRLMLRGKQIPHAGSLVGPYVTVSLGIVSLIPTQTAKACALLDLADRALYEAKSQGRDRVIVFSS